MAKRNWIWSVTIWWLLFSAAVLVKSSDLQREVDLLLTGGTVVTVDTSGRVITDGAVYQEDSVCKSGKMQFGLMSTMGAHCKAVAGYPG